MRNVMCRSCGSDRLVEVLDLGEHYVSDFTDGTVQSILRLRKAPLALDICQVCTLVQLRDSGVPLNADRKSVV